MAKQLRQSRTIMLFCFVVLFLCHFARGFLVPDGRTSVRTPIGEIVGYTSIYKVNGVEKVARNFLGIPYTEPPTGARRFRKPVRIRHLASPFDATKFGNSCYQFEGNSVSNNIHYSEDCLTLNIFAPEKLQSNGNGYPVLIAIHGGGFISGSSYGADMGYLSLRADIIVVVFNYRLNVFGFFSTADADSAGNFGLWDQKMAIEWVRDNIHSFGGDPAKITVGGESTGGVSVVYQMLGPNLGLFQRATAQSGCLSCPWAFRNHREAHNTSRQFAALLGCSQMDASAMVICLQSKTASEIRYVMNSRNYQLWTPVVDGQFFLDDPLTSLTNHFPSPTVENMFYSVDLITGANNKEGLSYLNASMANITESEIYDKFISDIASYMSINGEKDLPDIVKNALTLEYTDWKNIGDLNAQLERFTDFVTDIKFNIPVAQTALRHASNINKTTYVYKLSTAPPYHFGPVYQNLDGRTVAIHCDDLAFLGRRWLEKDFHFPSEMNFTVTDEQRNVGKAITTMWANFVKTGDPNKPEDVQQFINTTWTQYDPKFQRYLDITPTMNSSSMKERYSNRAIEFLTHLIPAILQTANDATHASNEA